MKSKYFVLKPKGSDLYAEASRNAMMAYAKTIRPRNKRLASTLTKWVKQETK